MAARESIARWVCKGMSWTRTGGSKGVDSEVTGTRAKEIGPSIGQ